MEEESDSIIFFVNGQEKILKNPNQGLTLLQYLRKDLGLCGAKLSCGQGECGSCTVTISRFSAGKIRHIAVNACLVKVCSLHHTSITTIEGLGNARDGLHPVQERIYKNHGSQCGFCTPGMVMSMSSLLREKEEEAPDIEDVQKCLQGNLCRCTGYRPILEGFETFCKDNMEDNHSCPALSDNREAVLRLDKSEFKPYCPSKDDPKVPNAIQNNCDNETLIHLKGNDKDWYRPNTLKQLLQLQNTLPDFELYGGGTGGYKKSHKKSLNTPIIQINGIEELKTLYITSKDVIIGSSLTITETADILNSTEAANNSSSVSALLEAMSTLASKQVRNVATIGGCVMWGHACSDIMPVLLATRSRLEVQTPNGIVTLPVDEEFLAKGLPDKSFIRSVMMPICLDNEGWTSRFMRKARRKEFDLPIVNACFHAKINKKNIIEDIHIGYGGAESNLPGAKQGKAVLASAVMSKLKGKQCNEVAIDDLTLWINNEKKLPFDENAPGDVMRLRKTLMIKFLQDFLENPTTTVEKKKMPRKSTLTYQKPDPNQPAQDPVTRPIAHLWAAEQATGEAIYVDDIQPYPNEVQVVLIQSTRAHAKIISIDFSDALKVQGVVGTITQDDLPKHQNFFGLMVRDEPIFSGEEVLYYGQIIAGIICTDTEAGKKARDLVHVQYEDLDSILSIEDAINKDSVIAAPLKLIRNQGITNGHGNVHKYGITNGHGNGHHLHNIKGRIHTGGQETFYMEPHSVLAIPVGEKDEFIVYHSTQEPSVVQGTLSTILGIPQHKIVVKVKRVGGAFGGKERCHNAIIASLVAWKFRRPARLIFSRKEDMEVTGHRHENIVDYDVDFDDDGHLLKTDFKVLRQRWLQHGFFHLLC